ncbi:hypothetical protein [Priestia megaterium]|uniref:hypothetical protein n=1 Tax=Priestia megaterium TaxID=1404 RepID=UPI0039F66129
MGGCLFSIVGTFLMLLLLAVLTIFTYGDTLTPVYRLEYVNIDNEREVVYVDYIDDHGGSVTYMEVNSSEYKTISGRYKISKFKEMTENEMKDYPFPKINEEETK